MIADEIKKLFEQLRRGQYVANLCFGVRVFAVGLVVST